MAVHEVRLPDDVERGAVGGPGFLTNLVTLSSGHEKRNIKWQRTRARWDIGYGIQSRVELQAVVDFFYARNGRGHSFRFKDWTDFELARQVIGVTDTTTTTFQIFKRYTSGAFLFDRLISKIVTGTETVWVNNVVITEGAGASEYQLDDDTGIITLGATLAAQTATNVEVLCEFDVHVRFDVDDLGVNAQLFNALSIPQIPIIEIRPKV